MEHPENFDQAQMTEDGYKFLEERGLSRGDIAKLAEFYTIDTKTMLSKIRCLFLKDDELERDGLISLVNKIEDFVLHSDNMRLLHDPDYKQAINNLQNLLKTK